MTIHSRSRRCAVVMALSVTLPACIGEVYTEPLEGPIRVGGRTSITPARALQTPGLKRRLCFTLPPGYDVDVHKKVVIAPNGDRGPVSARLRTESGAWFSLDVVALELAQGQHSVCLMSLALSGRMTLSFVEIELNSGLAWESPQGHWISAEKL